MRETAGEILQYDPPMIFRQLFDQQSSTYTYLLADGPEAVLLDPVFEQALRDAALVNTLTDLRDLVDRSLPEIRLITGITKMA